MIVSPGSAVLHAVWAVSLLAACSNAVLLRDSPALRLRGGLDASPASVVIRKPEIDKRTYRHVVLPNKLQAVLVSDTSAHAGAAALCVAAGQLDDPPEVEGLAHFLEHMLFLGTEKYPEESNFDQFCAAGGGYSNAWTSLDHTMYHFIVSEPKLHDALDRFASFFSCPLFSESGTDREIKAVDSENNKNLQDDDRREYQLLRSTCEQDHPMARFGTGNEETLRHPAGGKIDVRAELLKLHKGVYSANLMTLAVIGNVTLDKLEEDVREMFGTIVNREVEETRDWARRSPFGAAWRKAFLILPVAERRRVSLLFPSPPLAPEYKSKPHQLLSHLLGHEGPGSLLAVLKAQGWATELYAGPGTSLPNESVFGVTVCLTEEGLPKWRDVIQMVFHYVHIMRKSSFEDRLRIWNEVNITQELDFRFRDKEKEDGYVERIALSMAELPDDALPENLLTADALFLEPFDDRVNDKVDRLIDDHLKADNLRIHLSAPRDEIPRDWFASEEEATRSLEAVDRVSPPVPAEDGAGSEEGAAGAATVGGEGGEEAAQGGEGGAVAGGGTGEGGIDKEVEEVGEAVSGMKLRVNANEGEGDEGWKVEKWYGTVYHEKEIDASLKQDGADWFSHLTGLCRCSGHEATATMALPPPNKYASGDVRPMLPATGTEAGEAAQGGDSSDVGRSLVPEKVVSSKTVEGWHLKDPSFEAPRVSIHLQLDSPLVDADVKGAALLRLLLEYIDLCFNEVRYMAGEAGLGIEVSNNSFQSPMAGLRLMLHGWSGKVDTLLEDVLKAISAIEVDADVFAMAKERAETDYRNRKFQQPYAHAMLASNRILETPFFTHQERLEEVSGLKVEDLMAFKTAFLANLRVTGLVVGNIDAAEAVKLFTTAETLLGSPTRATGFAPQQMAKLPAGLGLHHVQLSPDPDHVDSAALLYLQVGAQSHKLDAHLSLLSQMFDKEAYSQLRTKEQLGYIVSAEVHARWGVTGLRVIVQSVRGPLDLHERVEAFLQSFETVLAEMPEDVFASHVESLINKKREPDMSLYARSSRIFYEVVSATFAWTRREEEVKHLEVVTKGDLLVLFQRFCAPDGESRRPVSVSVLGKEARAAHPVVVPSDSENFVSASWAEESDAAIIGAALGFDPASPPGSAAPQAAGDSGGAGADRGIGIGTFAQRVARFPAAREWEEEEGGACRRVDAEDGSAVEE